MSYPRTLAALFTSAVALTAPTSASALELEQVGSFDRPSHVTSDPHDPDRLFVVEIRGQIQLAEGADTTTFLDIEPLVRNGLWSMAFSPGYATDGLFYVAYAGVDDPGTTGEDESGYLHIDEFSANGDTADPASRREVLTAKYPAQPDEQRHFGGQLQFGSNGYLYVSTGDGGPQGDPDGDAQNLENLFGKVLRIDPRGSAPGDYTVPADNPFTDTAGCTDGCDEIWGYGLRNPWRFSFDRLTGDLVIGDVGYSSWEEVDFETGPNAGKGDNFGWNCREGAHPGPGEFSQVCSERAGTFTDPVFEYGHVEGKCSITGGYVVRDRALDDLYGRYLYGDWCTGELRSLNLDLPTASGDRSEGLSVPMVVSFGEDADCRIYAASLNGPVYRLTEPAAEGPVGCPPPEPTPQPPPPPDGSPGPVVGEPSNDFSLGKVKKNKRKGTAKLTVNVPGAGELELAKTKKVKADDKSAEEAGKEKLSIEPKGKAKKKLNEKGKAKVTANVTYTPSGGNANTESKKVKLVKR